jgi:hypothetical protein
MQVELCLYDVVASCCTLKCWVNTLISHVYKEDVGHNFI